MLIRTPKILPCNKEKNYEYVKDIKNKIEYKKENTGARKEKQKYRLIQLQNIENAKKMKDTGQIYKDYFTFREENLSGKRRRDTRERNSI